MPLTATFSVSNAAAFRLPLLDLPAFSQDLTVSFEDGTHLFTSPKFKLGTLYTHGERAIVGCVALRYTYDADTQSITVCGTDYPSADGMVLITHPEGSESESGPDTCVEHAAENAGFPADELHGRHSWNYHSQLMPGAAKVIKTIVRDANDALIAALEATTVVKDGDTTPPSTVHIRTLPPVLPLSTYLSLTHVHREGIFLEVYDPTKTYLPTDHITPIDSTWGGDTTLPAGFQFANVIGSTSDPRIAGLSWIALWTRDFGIVPTACTSQGYNGFHCGGGLVGGHVIPGQHATVVPAGSNNVLIVPICVAHNNNDGTYMGAVNYLRAVKLNNYLH